MNTEHQPSLVLLMQAKKVSQLFLALLMPKAKLYISLFRQRDSQTSSLTH